MSKLKNLTGLRYGKLIVVKRLANDNRRQATWLCLCDCGNLSVVSGSHLRTNHTKSCGCIQSIYIKEKQRFCLRGHDTWLVGRKASNNCKLCALDMDRTRYYKKAIERDEHSIASLETRLLQLQEIINAEEIGS